MASLYRHYTTLKVDGNSEILNYFLLQMGDIFMKFFQRKVLEKTPEFAAPSYFGIVPT